MNYLLQCTLLTFLVNRDILSHADELKWWQTSIVYQIYPRSYQDSNDDGVGDIPGIISRLDYLKSLHIGAIWLSPVYVSPMADFGYDVANHIDIDPIFGTLEDIDRLITESHKLGIKVIMDFIPNHTSSEHPWFIESRKGGKDNPYKDYYRWHDGVILQNGTRIPPNNWLSIFGGSAWEWTEERQQYYLHQFVPGQPDLDYRNPAVVKEMKEVLKFWAERGVDGFRVDAIQTLFEVENLMKNEPRSNKDGYTEHEHEYLDHVYTLHQDEIHDVISGWADVLNEYKQQTGKAIFMVMEVYDDNLSQTMKYYHSGADMPFNFGLILIDSECGGDCFQKLISQWMEMMPPEKWPNFVIGNHDQRRISTRKGKQYANALNMMLLTLPGTPTTYYGEEIAMLDIPMLSFEDTVDPAGKNQGPERYTKYTRDPSRSPMQWNVGNNAGFSNATKTWLPVHDNYKQLNVEVQQQNPQSPLHVYQKLAILRQKPAFQNNNLLFHVCNQDILSYIRYNNKAEAYMVILNLGHEKKTDNYSWKLKDGTTLEKAEVMVNTGNFEDGLYTPAQLVYLNGIFMSPGQGLVLRLTLSKSSKHNEEL